MYLEVRLVHFNNYSEIGRKQLHITAIFAEAEEEEGTLEPGLAANTIKE